MKYRKIHSILFSLALALAMIPLSAFAAAEDVLESAPAMPLAEEEQETDSAENAGAAVPYLPYSYYEKGDNISDIEEYYAPWLTKEEEERIRRFMADPNLIRNAPDCVNITENVAVGVYTLDPKDFDGETFHVILPGYRMTDEMLLSLLAAFNRLGIPFDPDLLNARNCTRGYLENRSFSYEESERAKAIQRQVHRGMITKDSIPAGTFCQTVTVAADPEQAWGPFDNTPLRFVRYPYRSMTDDELAAYVLTTESAWETDPAAVEKLALDRVRSFLDVPLALTVTNEQMSVNPDGSKMYMNDFLIPYTDGITGRPASPAGKPMQILVCQLQPAGSDELKLVYIYVFYYFDNSGYDGEWPEFSREEWIAMGRKEAEGIFRDLPEMEWDLADPESEEDNTVQVGAQSEGLDVDVQLHRWDGGCDVCFFSFGYAP